MELEEIVAVFVYINLQNRVKRVRCQLVVVGECHNVIVQFLIYPVYVVGPIFTLIQNTLNTCMGVEIGLFPTMRGINAAVGIEDVGSRERFGCSEIIYGTDACAHNCKQHNKQQRVQQFKYK